MKRKTQCSRRLILQNGCGILGSSLLGGLVPVELLANTGRKPMSLTAGKVPHRFLQIFLLGGWDSALATDPVVGTKASGGFYQSVYNTHEVTTVPGKGNLKVGLGLKGVASGFGAIPTAFVNGIFVEVTAHDLASRYLFSGTLSLSRSREYPALVARIGEASQGFPAHAIVGNEMPLGDTKLTAPPIWAGDSAMLNNLFQGPYNPWFEDAMVDRANQLVVELNDRYHQAVPEAAQKSLSSWQAANTNIASLYGGQYRDQFVITDAIKARYSIEDGDLWRPPAMMASAFLLLKSGLTPYVTASFGSYDTHTSHLANHLPEMTGFAANLNTLIGDLQGTPDPADASLTLADTTTILVVSEFVRTPKFNAGGGTDHWPSCSVILMGKGVHDNTVLGATDDQAQALGWNGTSGVAKTNTNTILPDHLQATLASHLGFNDIAQDISKGRLDGLFT